MATVNLGSIKFNWKGTYAGGTAYTIDDVVSYNGSSYICIQASTGNLPTNATYFEQMSSAGTNGTDLTTTLTTQGDIVYRDGSGLQRLGAGTSGQVLQTGGTGANPSWVDSSGGITEADMFRLAVSQAGGTNADITTNLERVDNASFSKIGTGMTESSGVYTFPSTGLYEVTCNPTIFADADTNCYIFCDVSTDSGSSYEQVIQLNIGSNTTIISVTGGQSLFVNVTNATTFRIKFSTSSMGANSYLRGDTTLNQTTFKFIKLGDSQ